MKRLAVVLAVLAVVAAALVACGPKEDKPPLTPDDPIVADPVAGDAGPG